jgi:hypothetical protein
MLLHIQEEVVMQRRRILQAIANLAAWCRALPSGFSSSVPTLTAEWRAPVSAPAVTGKNSAAAGVTVPTAVSPPSFEDYASVEARVDGEPVYGLDYMMYIYGVSPDLMPGIVLQQGNSNPRVKIRPKKSWEIKHNFLGSNTAQQPRSRQNDLPTFLPIHLIDGDRDTAWASFGSLRPEVRPEWIRIDLPIEATVASVALVLSKKFKPRSNFGRALPKQLTVKLSRDAAHWETVYENQNVDVAIADTLEITFPPRRAKQIWVVGNDFTKPLIESWAGLGSGMPGFSIGELEVRDPAGNNLALVSRGAGVTVSSTDFTHADNRLTAEALWAPLQYDMGMKWVRSCGGGCGPYQWFAMERSKGHYEVDSVMDRWFTDLAQRGVNLIMGADMALGNPIYQNPAKQPTWPDARWTGLPNPGWWSEETPQMLAAWPAFVDFLVRHFKDRAHIWEVGNEWNEWGWDDQRAVRYMRIFEITYAAIKKADPSARVMFGSTLTFAPDLILTLLGEERKCGVWNGRLMASGGDLKDLARSTLVVNDSVKVRDAEVHVDALNRGTWGVLLRYQSPEKFLLAGCGNYMQKSMHGYAPNMVFITERNGDHWTASDVTAKDLGVPFSDRVHFEVRLEGAEIRLTAADCNREVTVTHRLRDASLGQNGSLGLLQLTGANQEFQNFRVFDLGGNPIHREEFHGDNGSLPAGWKYAQGPNVTNPIKPGWAAKLDGLGWHPYNLPDGDYFGSVREMQKRCEALGFKGEYYASEFYNFFSYPTFSYLHTPIALSELGDGVMSAISAVSHSGLNAVGCTQIIHFTGCAFDSSNCRVAWPSELAVPVQPSVMYYLWRTLATVMDDFRPRQFPVKISAEEEAVVFTFERSTGERMVAFWLAHRGATQPNDITALQGRVTLEGVRARQVWAVDLLNGSEQELRVESRGDDTVVDEVMITNYPTLVRFERS